MRLDIVQTVPAKSFFVLTDLDHFDASGLNLYGHHLWSAFRILLSEQFMITIFIKMNQKTHFTAYIL